MNIIWKTFRNPMQRTNKETNKQTYKRTDKHIEP